MKSLIIRKSKIVNDLILTCNCEMVYRVFLNGVEKTLQKIIDNLGLTRLNKVGSFSNGECLFEKAG